MKDKSIQCIFICKTESGIHNHIVVCVTNIIENLTYIIFKIIIVVDYRFELERKANEGYLVID